MITSEHSTHTPRGTNFPGTIVPGDGIFTSWRVNKKYDDAFFLTNNFFYFFRLSYASTLVVCDSDQNVSRVTVAQMIQHLKKFIFVREFKKTGFRGRLKYLAFVFLPFCEKKGFCDL